MSGRVVFDRALWALLGFVGGVVGAAGVISVAQRGHGRLWERLRELLMLYSGASDRIAKLKHKHALALQSQREELLRCVSENVATVAAHNRTQRERQLLVVRAAVMSILNQVGSCFGFV